MGRIWLAIGSLSLLVAVAVAAATGHAPATGADASARHALDTARELHMVHALALLLVGMLADRDRQNGLWHVAGTAFLSGIILFPCGIYLNRLLDISAMRPLVPVGGAAFMLGWIACAAAALRPRKKTAP